MTREAEQSVIGAILIRPETMPEIAAFLTPEDFSQETHGQIFQAIQELHGQGKPIDYVTVTNLLRDKNLLEKVGGPVFLVGLSEQVGFSTNAKYYAQTVKDKSLIRQLGDRAKKISNQCQKPISDTTDFLQWAESQIYEITGSNGRGRDCRVISAKTMLGRTYSKEAAIIGRGILPQGGGLIIAGESGEGKSLLRSELAIHLAMGWDIWELSVPTARRVFIFTFENPESTEAYRLKKMLEGLQITNFPDRLSFSDPTIRLDLNLKRDQAKALEIVSESKAEVIIYDPLTSLHSVNENDNVQVRKVLDTITEINRKTGSTAIVIHHFGKPQEGLVTAHRTRGASSIKDWTDTLIAVTRKKHESKTLRQIEFIKVRNGPEAKPILLERDEYFLHHVTEEEMLCPPEKVKAILETLGGKVEGQEPLKQAIMEATGCIEKSARSFINLAVERKAIKCESNPQDSRKKDYVL